ncbi:protein kinase, partial [bacterium]|nr:protein kinase [bacterium]
MGNKKTICNKCKTENPPDNDCCKKCGFPLKDETDVIKFNENQKLIIASRYKIVQEIGRGSMGIVYKALDKTLNRFIALKTINFDEKISFREEKIEKLLKEAQAVAKLNHLNIITIHDAGMDNNLTYIAMEYIDGISLSELISPGGIEDLSFIFDICIQMCNGMNHAHEKGIIHRDLKPSNILLFNEKMVKISDFGIAKMVNEKDYSKKELGIWGTPSYMAPERFKGSIDDFRSDIFSIGVIIYELLTGNKPFSGETTNKIIFKILNSDYEPINNVRPEISQSLENIIRRAIEKDPEKRYQNVKNILMDLHDNYREFDVEKTTPKRKLIWNIAHHRNINFTGREDILEKIRSELKSYRAEPNTLAIHGLGGIGKTQIVLEYIFRYSSEYSVIWWIKTNDLSTLISDFTTLSEYLELSTKNLKENEKISL